MDMDLGPLNLLKEMMNIHGIPTLLLRPPYENIMTFDERLRSQLYPNYDYTDIIERLENICTESTIYLVEDEFHVHYVFIKLSTAYYEGPAYLFIGPYLTQTPADLIQRFVAENEQPIERIAALKEYFAGIPVISHTDGIEAEISVLVDYLFQGEEFSKDSISLQFLAQDGQAAQIIERKDATIRMEVIEERYRLEDDLLKAVELGDHQQALKLLSAFSRFEIDDRVSDRLRDRKNYFFTSNSLMRKAVQRADVHPAHIDGLSSFFARKIEAARTLDDLSDIMQEMLRKYCLLVKNHSLRRYSKPIQNVLNYIDFNYVEALSLQTLAALSSINPSYLSAQFKKEVGTTVVDYINQCRIGHAQKLLVTTSLPINKIAEMVGYMDENYFARVFKKHTQKSATHYRRLFK